MWFTHRTFKTMSIGHTFETGHSAIGALSATK